MIHTSWESITIKGIDGKLVDYRTLSYTDEIAEGTAQGMPMPARVAGEYRAEATFTVRGKKGRKNMRRFFEAVRGCEKNPAGRLHDVLQNGKHCRWCQVKLGGPELAAARARRGGAAPKPATDAEAIADQIRPAARAAVGQALALLKPIEPRGSVREPPDTAAASGEDAFDPPPPRATEALPRRDTRAPLRRLGGLRGAFGMAALLMPGLLCGSMLDERQVPRYRDGDYWPCCPRCDADNVWEAGAELPGAAEGGKNWRTDDAARLVCLGCGWRGTVVPKVLHTYNEREVWVGLLAAEPDMVLTKEQVGGLMPIMDWRPFFGGRLVRAINHSVRQHPAKADQLVQALIKLGAHGGAGLGIPPRL